MSGALIQLLAYNKNKSFDTELLWNHTDYNNASDELNIYNNIIKFGDKISINIPYHGDLI